MWILWLSLGVCIGAAIVIGIEIALIWQLYVKPLRDQRELNDKGGEGASVEGKDKDKGTQVVEVNGGNLTAEQKKVKKKVNREIQWSQDHDSFWDYYLIFIVIE